MLFCFTFLINSGLFFLLEKKNQEKKTVMITWQINRQHRKLLDPVGQILTDYWDNNSEVDVDINVLLFKFY